MMSAMPTYFCSLKKPFFSVWRVGLCLAFLMQTGLAQTSKPTPPRDVWQEIANSLNVERYKRSYRVKKEISWYLNHPKSLMRLTQNAQPYIYYVTNEIKKRHMPLEIALLPMIESNYNPHKVSSASASGMWQLLPGTARDLGVNINHWYDGRNDIVSSTKAALNYLQYLRDRYHSWPLAFAAYNSGGGTVRKAIRYNKQHHRSTRYEALPLPTETKRYVPKLVAIATILSKPDAYHIRIKPVKNKPYFTSVKVDATMDLKEIAKLSGTRIAVINRLNPGFKHNKVIASRNANVLIPIQKKETFTVNLASYMSEHQGTDNVYLVQRGDSLSKIASSYHISTRLLQHSNHLHDTMIRIGQLLYIPL